MKTMIILCAACGVGKSTARDVLADSGMLKNYECLDADRLDINWWDYADTEHPEQFSNDCLAEAVRRSGEKNLLLSTCMNPFDYYGKLVVPQEVTSTFFVAMTCSDEEITRRLKARPEERMCGSDEFIAGQIEYNGWFRKNSGKFQLYIDNTGMTVEETARIIADFANRLG